MEKRPGFFEYPLVRALLGFLGFVVAYLVLGGLLRVFEGFYLFSEAQSRLDLALDFALILAGILLWSVFFAQFILPVRTLKDRLSIFLRLWVYLFGWHGAALFVENGVVRAREDERARKGIGVIWLDSASTAVLRTPTKFTRTVGPGVHFTGKNEKIAATADLHPLTQSVGPEEKDTGALDPFTIAPGNEEYETVRKRHGETLALTRDGIEVGAAISVTFGIRAQAGEGNTRFGFNATTAEKAIRDSIVRGAQLDQPVWSELPAKMAVDLWREYARKFRINDLFEIGEDRAETGLQVINGMMSKRMKQREVEVLDEFGRVVLLDPATRPVYSQYFREGRTRDAEDLLQKMQSTEFRILSEMGLEIKGVNIKRVLFAPEIEERLVKQWNTTWMKSANKEQDQVERGRKLAESAGQEDAVKQFAENASRDFVEVQPTSKYHTLEMLVHSTFLGIRRDTALLKRTNSENRDIMEIYNWLRNKRNEDA
jgi:hypothetical protein